MRAVRAWVLGALLVACSPGGGHLPPPRPPVPRITSVAAPSPIVVGTILSVRGLDLDRVGAIGSLVVRSGANDWLLAEQSSAEDTVRTFLATDMLISELGEGSHDVELVVHGASGESEPFSTSWTIATSLPLRLDAGPTGTVHFEDVVVLHGAGFTTESEGAVRAHVVGTFTGASGGPSPIDLGIPMELADLTARDRAVLVLTTDLGGATLRTGTLAGTITLESTLASGARRTTAPVPLMLTFATPELFAIEPSTVSVGQIASVRGVGFLGRPGRASETTLLRFAATFTPEGGAPSPFTMELVPTWTSGTELGLVLDARVDGGVLVAALFGAQRGVLTGDVTPIALRGTDELAGRAVPVVLTLGAPRQVVELRFLPGWYDSLARLGLAAAEHQVIDAIVARIHALYAGHAVEVRTTPVTDYVESAYAIIEIGGPDPNGSGLFGYDNAAGKDAGNLRLFDRIGGANAQQQADGFPGYGGVFVESMLWWSAHPELEGDRPSGAPPIDPLFDAVFDPVRTQPATYDEAMGVGATDRIAVVARAVRALGNLVGETSAHELGHSLGLAQPFGDPNVFHDPGDGEGCLMDNGVARPLGERMAEPGYTPSHFCYDGPDYLSLILAVE